MNIDCRWFDYDDGSKIHLHENVIKDEYLAAQMNQQHIGQQLT